MKTSTDNKCKDINYTTLINFKNTSKTPEFNLIFQTFGFSKFFENKKEDTNEFNTLFIENINIQKYGISTKSLRAKRNKENIIEVEFSNCLNSLINGGSDDIIDSEESV